MENDTIFQLWKMIQADLSKWGGFMARKNLGNQNVCTAKKNKK